MLSVVSEGMPLIYNGQEAGNRRRLAFFEKDPIDGMRIRGRAIPEADRAEAQNSALWNGGWGARMVGVSTVPLESLHLCAAERRDKVFAVFNFSAEPQTVTFVDGLHHETYTDFFSGETVEFLDSTGVELEPWGYRVYVR